MTHSIPNPTRGPRSRRIVAVLAVLALITAVSLAGHGGGPGPLGPPTAGACGVLPVSVKVRSRFPQVYARQYRKDVPVELTNRGNWKIGGLYVQIYTFGGLRIGSSPALGSLRPGHTRKTVVHIGFPIQAGKITFVVKGTDKGCTPPEQISHVVDFHSCQTRLPVLFPNPPGGHAADYSGYLSVDAEAKEGEAIFRPRSRVYTFGGAFVGQDINHYHVIYGEVRFDNRLGKGLRRGGYTMIVRGWLNQPKSCGPKTAQVNMHFK